MATGMNMAFDLIMPFVRMVFYGIIFLGIVIPAGYYFLVLKRRRVWIANIYERRGDTAILVENDKVIERRIRKKNAHLYILSRKKYAVQPIKEEYVTTHRGKNYVEYLRVGSDYIPFVRRYRFDKVGAEIEFEPMPYDVQMQMISTEKEVEEIFKKKEDWMAKYGALVGLGIICLLAIVLMYMYYDFVSTSLEPIKESGHAIQAIAERMINK